MKTTLDFLEAVKTKHGFTSDYQLSKHLECTRGAISSYRTGRTHLDEEMACKIADDLGIEAGFVLSCIASERSKNAKVKAAWAWTANHLGGLAAALAVIAVIAVLPFGLDILSGYQSSLEGAPALGFIGLTSAANNIHYANFTPAIFSPENWPFFAALLLVFIRRLPAPHSAKKQPPRTGQRHLPRSKMR